MKERIKALFHSHKWKTIKQDESTCYYNGHPDGTMYIYIQECPECGKMRCYKFRI